MRAYDSHQLKTIFDVSTLDLAKVALSFGFTVPPVVDLSKCSLEIYALYVLLNITRSSIYFLNAELSHKIRSRPEKRVGGGGYGSLKNMNKDDQMKRKFRQVNGSDFQNKKFTR